MDTCARCDRPRGHDGSCLDYDEIDKMFKHLDYSNPFHVEVEGWFVGVLKELVTEARRLTAKVERSAPYEEALNTIAQQMCLCEPLNDTTLQDEDEEECPSCFANRTLDGLKKGEV
jgi:hypothetical protein